MMDPKLSLLLSTGSKNLRGEMNEGEDEVGTLHRHQREAPLEGRGMKVVLEHGADSPGVACSWRQSFRSVQDLDPSVSASPAPRGYVRRLT